MRFYLACLALLCACTNPESAERVLRSQGFTDVEAGGYDALSCAKDDEVRTHFVATSPSGARVSGTVCCGLVFKNCTVRFD